MLIKLIIIFFAGNPTQGNYYEQISQRTKEKFTLATYLIKLFLCPALGIRIKCQSFISLAFTVFAE